MKNSVVIFDSIVVEYKLIFSSYRISFQINAIKSFKHAASYFKNTTLIYRKLCCAAKVDNEYENVTMNDDSRLWIPIRLTRWKHIIKRGSWKVGNAFMNWLINQKCKTSRRARELLIFHIWRFRNLHTE